MNDSQSGPGDRSSSEMNSSDANPDADTEGHFEPEPPVAARSSFKRRHWGKLLLLTLIMIPVAGFAVWSLVTLNWTYSEGDRPGFVQKIASKGYICKTWEGILYNDLQGFRADSFAFTVRSDSLAKVLQSLSGKQVSLHYQQHVNVPSSCFGDSEYFVSGVRELK